MKVLGCAWIAAILIFLGLGYWSYSIAVNWLWWAVGMALAALGLVPGIPRLKQLRPLCIGGFVGCQTVLASVPDPGPLRFVAALGLGAIFAAGLFMTNSVDKILVTKLKP